MDWSLVLQITGVVLGLLYLWLEYRADIRLWIVGLIMPVVHGSLYFSKGLYADASMQVYYILAGIYGWVIWSMHRQKKQSEKAKTIQNISHTPRRVIYPLLTVYLVAHVSIYLFLTELTDSKVPFWDSMTTALSIVAMWMLSRKYVEQWLVWFIVDLITVGLYLYKEIPLTACLYLLYTVLAFMGYLRWRKQARATKA